MYWQGAFYYTHNNFHQSSFDGPYCNGQEPFLPNRVLSAQSIYLGKYSFMVKGECGIETYGVSVERDLFHPNIYRSV